MQCKCYYKKKRRYLWHKSYLPSPQRNIKETGKRIDYGHFVANIFDGKERRVYDNNKINYVKTKSVLQNEEFPENIYAVSYIRNIDNIESPSLPYSEWPLTQKEEEEFKVIFIS